MPPTIPIELAEARRAREQAWNEYMQVLDAPHTHEEFTAALDKACAADREAVNLYNRWQAVGGTSNITSIVAAEIEQENQRVTDWLQADNAAATYGERAYISGGEVCYASDMMYRPASEPDDDMPF